MVVVVNIDDEFQLLDGSIYKKKTKIYNIEHFIEMYFLLFAE
jgi:hypothetical protein